MSDELTWIKAEITKILADVAVNGQTPEYVVRRLERVLTGHTDFKQDLHFSSAPPDWMWPKYRRPRVVDAHSVSNPTYRLGSYYNN